MKIKQNYFMNKKNKNVCRASHHFEKFLTFVSALSGYV